MNQARPALLHDLSALALCLTLASAAQAQNDFRTKTLTPGDYSRLPEWCIDTQAGPYGSPEGGAGLNRSPRAAQWVGAMGTDFWHMHHYCWGLRDMMRLRDAVMSTPDRVFFQGRAVVEFTYVINNCKPTMPLLPEVYLKLGEVYLMQNNLPAASSAFEASRRLKPDYWPAYDRWIAVLIGLKQYESAQTLAEQGLAAAPAEPNLTARLAEIKSASRKAARPVRTSASASAAAATSR